MNGREDYIRRKNEVQRPSINFTQRDNVRDFARSGHGQNYNRMMDLQQQLPTMTRDDPRVQEFKDRRRTFNRYGKYPMGEMLGYTPQQMQEQYVDLSRDVRQTNKPVYSKMYPLTNLAMDYGEGGGLLGLAVKGLTGDIGKMGSDISSAVGIAGAVDDTPDEQADYVGRTFGFYPTDVHPELQREEGQLVFPEEVPLPSDSTADIIETDLSMENLPYHSKRSMFPRDNKRIIPGLVDPMPLQEPDYPTPEPIEPLPFDDSAREAGIMSQYPTNFIGPRDDPSRRPDMMDVAGPGINRGLIPYPEYNDNMVYTPQMGRGDLPRYGYDYAGERQAREEEYRLQQLLNSILNQEEDTPQAPPPLSIGATR